VLGTVRALLFSHSVLIVGAFLTSPLFGWLGNHWRNERWWTAVGRQRHGAFCFEPLAHAAVGSAIRATDAWVGEVAVGLLMTVYVVNEKRLGLSRRRSARRR
jgi:hypothetical protein